MKRWDVFLLVAALIGGIYFFLDYPNVHPHRAVDASLSHSRAESVATDYVHQLGYSTDQMKTRVRLRQRVSLLNYLQDTLGRSSTINQLSDSLGKQLPVYYWQVDLQPVQTGEDDGSNIAIGSTDNGDDDLGLHEQLSVYLAQEGKIVGFTNSLKQLPKKQINREALSSVFAPGSKAGTQMFTGVSDSILTRMLYFDLEFDHDSIETGSNIEDQVIARLRAGQPFRYDTKDAGRLAQYYLDRSIWADLQLKIDTVFIERIGSVNAARIRLNGTIGQVGTPVDLQLDISPTGALLGMEPSFPVQKPRETLLAQGYGITMFVVSLVLVLIGIVLFFRRLRARVIDTKTALFVSIIGGVMIPLQILLAFSHSEMDQIGGLGELMLFYGMIMGVMGSISVLGVFLASSLGESITRQVWPEKLGAFDYIRRGYLLSKPVGQVLVRGIALTLLVAGLWTLLWRGLPMMYPNFGSTGSTVFLSDHVYWPPLYLIFRLGALSLISTMVLYLVFGSQLLKSTGNRLVSFLVIVVLFMLLPIFPVELLPTSLHLLAMAVMGLIFTGIFVQWDYLTTLVSYFLFIYLIRSSQAWVPQNSPETALLVSIPLLLVLLLIMGGWALARGKSEQMLPRYIPDYVEELAQEERIKQELQIAKKVQQSFLPMQVPSLKNLDIAAVCTPAFETGGDYYDFIPLDDHRIAVAIGDVSGKGIEAAFYMTFTKGILHSLCREVDSPAELLIKTNKLFYDNAQRGRFISMIYGIVDLKKRTFCFARAGHNPILFKHGQNSAIEYLQPKGIGLGLSKDKEFDENIEEVTLDLKPDDVLLLYTDGLNEALNTNDEFYGVNRIKQIIKKRSKASASKLMNALYNDVTSFMGAARQHDDLTMMVIKLNGDQ